MTVSLDWKTLAFHMITLSLFGTLSQWSLGKRRIDRRCTFAFVRILSKFTLRSASLWRVEKPTVQKMEASNCSVQIKTPNVCNARLIGCWCLKFQQICLWMLVRQSKQMKSMFHHMVQELPFTFNPLFDRCWDIGVKTCRWVYFTIFAMPALVTTLGRFGSNELLDSRWVRS